MNYMGVSSRTGDGGGTYWDGGQCFNGNPFKSGCVIFKPGVLLLEKTVRGGVNHGGGSFGKSLGTGLKRVIFHGNPAKASGSKELDPTRNRGVVLGGKDDVHVRYEVCIENCSLYWVVRHAG